MSERRREPSKTVEGRRDPSVGAAEVRRLAELAALELTDAEVVRLAEELPGLLAHFEVLREGAEGAEGAEGGTAEAAEGAEGADAGSDGVGADPLHGAVGDRAPGFEAGFFTVPRPASFGGGEDAE